MTTQTDTESHRRGPRPPQRPHGTARGSRRRHAPGADVSLLTRSAMTRRVRASPTEGGSARPRAAGATASPASRVSTSIRSDQRDHGRHQDRAEVRAHHAAQRPVVRDRLSTRRVRVPSRYHRDGSPLVSQAPRSIPTAQARPPFPTPIAPAHSRTARRVRRHTSSLIDRPIRSGPDRHSQPHPTTRHDRRQTPPEDDAGRRPRSVPRPRRGPKADETDDEQRTPHRIRPPPPQVTADLPRQRAREPKAPTPHRRSHPRDVSAPTLRMPHADSTAPGPDPVDPPVPRAAATPLHDS